MTPSPLAWESGQPRKGEKKDSLDSSPAGAGAHGDGDKAGGERGGGVEGGGGWGGCGREGRPSCSRSLDSSNEKTSVGSAAPPSPWAFVLLCATRRGAAGATKGSVVEEPHRCEPVDDTQRGCAVRAGWCVCAKRSNG